MKRHVFCWVAPVLGCVALATLLAPVAAAHGGQFRGPGDAVPPRLREPFDPTPPPPPPPPSPVPTPTTPPSGGPTNPLGPTTPPTVAPPAVTAPDVNKPGRRKTTAVTYDDWRFWYRHNNATIENLKWWIYHPESTRNPLFNTAEKIGAGLAGGEMRYTERKVREIVIPALLWAMDPKNVDYSDTESAAYIALAKVTNDPDHIQLIASGLDPTRGRSLLVMDSAALGLGLLRRTAADEQFTPRELDRVRGMLFDAFERTDLPIRTRGLAAISIGLLGDQPTGSLEYTGDAVGAARATTLRLFDLLEKQRTTDDLQIGLLMAIGLQPASSLERHEREILKDCALKGRINRDKRSQVVRAHAALALGRIGTADDVGHLENMLTVSRVPRDVQRSAAIGLGLLGRSAQGHARVESAEVLLRRLGRTKDHATRNFGIISLGNLLVADVKSTTTDVLGNTKAEEYLLETARSGHYTSRGFAALALGLVAREITDDLDIEAWQTFRRDAVGMLREHAGSKRLDARTHAAFCTALGIARDDESREVLRKLVADRRKDKTVRGYAALALGLIGNATPEVTKTIASALQERSSEELRRQTATALGLLGNPSVPGTKKDAVDLLLEELKQARSQAHKGEIVLALARIGDHRALERLVKTLKDEREQDLTRALAVSGLGVIGDLELIPSLARGSKDVNYRASTDLLNEFLSIL